jgi:hypothetical protein
VADADARDPDEYLAGTGRTQIDILDGERAV